MVRVQIRDDYNKEIGRYDFPAMPRKGEVVVIENKRWVLGTIHYVLDKGWEIRVRCARG